MLGLANEGLFNSLCDYGKAHSFSEPQFPHGLGFLLPVSLLQQVAEWMGLWCCGNADLVEGPEPFPSPIPEVAAPFCFFSRLVSEGGGVHREVVSAERGYCVLERSARPGREGPAMIWGRAKGPRSHVLGQFSGQLTVLWKRAAPPTGGGGGVGQAEEAASGQKGWG